AATDGAQLSCVCLDCFLISHAPVSDTIRVTLDWRKRATVVVGYNCRLGAMCQGVAFFLQMP
ncbi:MAG: hypothetical protein KDE53_25390, partial [Caldilineaceae bacterium]|nr:hypothetical protein [Caldilineaceae bacterium]